jgi:hypothetical protein
MNSYVSPRLRLAHKVTERFAAFSNVEAIALAGSQTVGTPDQGSDIDVYVYITTEIPLSERVALVEALGATRADLGLDFWGPGDEWYDAETGIEVDVIYWETTWIEEQLKRVLQHHQASTGYTTCFWHTIRNSQSLYDPKGWFQTLKVQSEQPYPEELRQAIIAKNHPILERVIPAYLSQIKKAVTRHDLVSVNHRVTALLASYFDTLFALNRLPNPGEKRLLEIASKRCTKIPEEMAEQITSVLRAVSSADQRLITKLEVLIEGLDRLLREEGFDPETSLYQFSI